MTNKSFIDMALVEELIAEAEAEVAERERKYDGFNVRIESVEQGFFALEAEFRDLPGDIPMAVVERMKSRRNQLEVTLEDGVKRLEDFYQELCKARQRLDDLQALAASLSLRIGESTPSILAP